MGSKAIDLVEHMLRFDPARRITGQFLNFLACFLRFVDDK